MKGCSTQPFSVESLVIVIVPFCRLENQAAFATIIEMNPTALRIGIGHDTHRLKAGGPLRIGGIDIPFDRSLDGHSDADVLLHAITDALLGAAGLGDIGELFPDSSQENKNRDSAEMLAVAWALVRKSGYQLINLDCIVFAQQPKLLPYRSSIVQRIAEILRVDQKQVALKAKTGENIGLVGELKIMQAQCVALLVRSELTDSI